MLTKPGCEMQEWCDRCSYSYVSKIFAGVYCVLKIVLKSVIGKKGPETFQISYNYSNFMTISKH